MGEKKRRVANAIRAEGKGYLSVTIFPVEEIFSMLRSPDANSVRLLSAAQTFIMGMDRKPLPPLCMTCERELVWPEAPTAIVLVEAMTLARGGDGLVSGVCPHCYGLPDLRTRVNAHLRTVWPDIREAQISPDAGTA